MFRGVVGRTLGTASGVILSCGSAMAQTVTPGQVNDTLAKPPALVPAPQPSVSRPVARPAAPPSANGGSAITVQRFHFTGHLLFSDEQLRALLSSYTNRPVTLLELYEAADRVAQFYADQGYTLASVNLPPQKVSEGIVTLQISEGRVATVEIVGAQRYQTEHISRYLHSFRAREIYRGDSLQQGLRTLSALPGLSVKATVRPGTDTGTSDVVLNLTEDAFQGGVSIDNYGRESVGEYRLTASAAFNSPLRIEDQLQLVGLISEDELTRYGSISYAMPLNFRGTRARFSYGHAEFSVDGSPVDGRSRNGEIAIEHPWIHDAHQRLLVSFGGSRTISNADFSGLIFNRTSITLLRLGLTYTRNHDNASVTQVTTNVSSNFDSLSIEDFAGNEVEGNQRLKWDVDVQHLLPLTSRLQVYLRAVGVWSPDPLVDTEKFSLGGPSGVRGFPSAEIRGDTGYFGSVTLQHLSPLSFASLRSRIFVDGGEVFSVDAPDAGSLSSAGVGFDLIRNPLTFRLDWAYPLGNRRISDDRDSGRVFGALSASF